MCHELENLREWLLLKEQRSLGIKKSKEIQTSSKAFENDSWWQLTSFLKKKGNKHFRGLEWALNSKHRALSLAKQPAPVLGDHHRKGFCCVDMEFHVLICAHPCLPVTDCNWEEPGALLLIPSHQVFIYTVKVSLSLPVPPDSPHTFNTGT